MVSRWTVVPGWTPITKFTDPRSREVSGGWAAVGAVPNGTRKKNPCFSSLAVTPYQKVLVTGEQKDVPDTEGQRDDHDGGQGQREPTTGHRPPDGRRALDGAGLVLGHDDGHQRAPTGAVT
jgi:hypothetical protein